MLVIYDKVYQWSDGGDNVDPSEELGKVGGAWGRTRHKIVNELGQVEYYHNYVHDKLLLLVLDVLLHHEYEDRKDVIQDKQGHQTAVQDDPVSFKVSLRLFQFVHIEVVSLARILLQGHPLLIASYHIAFLLTIFGIFRFMNELLLFGIFVSYFQFFLGKIR